MYARQTKAVVHCCGDCIFLYKFGPGKETVMDISAARPPVKIDVCVNNCVKFAFPLRRL